LAFDITEVRVIGSSEINSANRVEPDGAHLCKPSFLDAFRRITTSGQFIPEIDGLRFIAISLVILHHLALFVSIQQGRPEGLLSLGQRGVELFFAISGFILAVPFAMHFVNGEKPVRLGRYFLRRFTRLEPPYLISLFLLTAMRVLFRGEDFSIIWWNLLFSIFYVHGFMKGMPSQINGVAWSLEIEIQFYLVMPLLALLFLIRNRWIRRGVILLFAAAAMSIQPILFRSIFPGVELRDGHVVQVPYYLERHLVNYIQYFLVGLLLADIYVTEWRGSPPPVRKGAMAWGDFTWLLGWPLLIYVLTLDGLVSRILFPILIFILYLSLFYSIHARRLMRIEILTVIGGMCYSIYLLHNSVIQVFGPLLARMLPSNFAAAVGLAGLCLIPLILIFCGLYFRLIERPCMRPDWPRRLYRWISGLIFVEETSEEQNSIGNPP
jgi:peptidoglycan/LPS O-acetylase OafA/YrhL